jgi:hypothetical protein
MTDGILMFFMFGTHRHVTFSSCKYGFAYTLNRMLYPYIIRQARPAWLCSGNPWRFKRVLTPRWRHLNIRVISSWLWRRIFPAT